MLRKKTPDALPAGGRYPKQKRIFDLVVASALMVFVVPLMAFALLVVRLETRGSPIFTQIRVGLNGKLFRIYKIRTMYIDSTFLKNSISQIGKFERTLHKSPYDPRVTKIGRFLRASSLDELPQLLNVLKGEMSLVGPRPHSLYDVSRFPQGSDIRHQMPPGMTGLWQVSGRNLLGFEEMLMLDMDYVCNWTFGRDLLIMLRTSIAVLRFNTTA